MNKGNALVNLGQLPAAIACHEEAIGLYRQLVETEGRPELANAQPFLQSASQSDLFQREYVNFIARLRKLSPDEQERLYVALGERAAEVRKLIEE